MVVSAVLAAGAADEVEAVQQALVQPWEAEDDVIVRMGPRFLTMEGLHEAVRPDARAFDLIGDSRAKGRAASVLTWSGVGAGVVGLGLGALTVAMVQGAGVLTPLTLGLLLTAGVAALVAIPLLIASVVLQAQAAVQFNRGVTEWNGAAFARAQGPGTPFVRAAQAAWFGLCEENVARACIGSKPVESDEQVAASFAASSPENAEVFRSGSRRLALGMGLTVSGLVLEGASIALLVLLSPPLSLAVSLPVLVAGFVMALIGAYQTHQAGRALQQSLAEYNFSVMSDALRAARKADAERALVDSPAAAPQEAPPEVSPEPPPEAPTAPPPPPPVGPTRQPLRPQTHLDGPLPGLLLATF